MNRPTLLPLVPRWMRCEKCEVKWKDVPSSTCWNCSGPGQWSDFPNVGGSQVVVSTCTPPATTLE